jgi:hypothetical protein
MTQRLPFSLNDQRAFADTSPDQERDKINDARDHSVFAGALNSVVSPNTPARAIAASK